MCFLSSGARIDGEYNGELYREVDNGTQVQDVCLALLSQRCNGAVCVRVTGGGKLYGRGFEYGVRSGNKRGGVTDCHGALH